MVVKQLTAGMQCAYYVFRSVRDLANGDHLIVSTALTSAQTERNSSLLSALTPIC